jgi:hypothetical protein
VILVLRITAAIDAIGTLQSWYFTDGRGWVTRPTDTPPRTHIAPRLMSGGYFRREMFAGDGLFGAVRAGWGEFVIANADGEWLGAVDHEGTQYGWDGQAFALWAGDEDGDFPADFTQVGAGSIRSVKLGLQTASVVIRDDMDRLNKPVLTRTFLGTGALEGDASLAGKRAARSFGDTLPVPCTLVDAAKLIYHVCDGISATPASAGAHDGGVSLTMGAVYASTADLNATAPTAGQARFYGGGPCYVRLGSSPAYDVSCAPSQIRIDAGSAVWLSQLAVDAGIAGALGSVIGVEDHVPIDSSDTYLQVMARQCKSEPAWFGFDALGTFTAGTIDDPSGGSPVYTLRESGILSIERSAPPGLDVPVWRVQTKGRRNWMFGRTLAGGAPGYMRRQWYSSASASDVAVQTVHALAGDMSIESPRYSSGGAQAFLDLHKLDRDFLRVVVPMSRAVLAAIDLGDCVEVKHSRFGMSAGKKFLAVGIENNYGARTVTFSLWG